jgi:Family of unknown function (DUF6353)
MTFASIAKTAEKFTADNSPTILTAIGVAGTITTAVLSAKAGIESASILSEEPAYMTKKEKVKLTWQVWVLPVGVGTITVTSIIFANKIGTRRAAAMATAYVISETAFDDYKSKVVEKLGKSKERDIHDFIAQDRVDQAGASTIIIDDGDVLCFEQYTGRYFKSTMETIKKAQNDTNYQVLHDGYASLSDFYQRIGLPITSISEELGWNSDTKLEILFSTVMSENQKPCISIDFNVTPVRDYHKFL